MILNQILYHLYFNRYYAIIVVISGSIPNDIGPYNEEEADRANSNGQPYTYIAGIVETSDISDYPYPYIVGNESKSSIGGVDYENVPLQSNTMYAVIVRAYTTDDLVSIFLQTKALPCVYHVFCFEQL